MPSACFSVAATPAGPQSFHLFLFLLESLVFDLFVLVELLATSFTAVARVRILHHLSIFRIFQIN
jgi:hypothetical protein